MRKYILLLLVAAISHGWAAQAVFGQFAPDERRERRRQLVEGLLKSLIESQTERAQPADTRPRPRPVQSLPADVRQARQLAQGYSQESTKLIGALRQDERLIPSLRPLLGDAINIKGSAELLVRHCDEAKDLNAINQHVEQLDRDWRVLSHRLGQIPNLSATCRTCIRNMDQYEQQLCKLCKVEPQLSREELISLNKQVSNELNYLLEDTYKELYHHKSRNPLILQGRHVQAHLNEVTHMLTRGARRSLVVEKYKLYFQAWREYVQLLRPLENKYFESHARRIVQFNHTIRELLWLPTAIDIDRIRYAARGLQQHADHLVNGLTVKTLAQLKNPGPACNKSIEFYRLCNVFAKTCASNADLEELIWDYRVLQVECENTERLLGGIHSPVLHKHLAGCRQGIDELRECFNIRPVMDLAVARHLAVQAEIAAARLTSEVYRCLSESSGYTPALSNQARQYCSDFQTAARQFHGSLIAGAPEAQLRQRCLELHAKWRQVHTAVPSFSKKDQLAIRRAYADLPRSMVKLQIMFAM